MTTISEPGLFTCGTLTAIYYTIKKETAINIEVIDTGLLFHLLQVVIIIFLSTKFCFTPFLPSFTVVTKINEFYSYNTKGGTYKYLLDSL